MLLKTLKVLVLSFRTLLCVGVLGIFVIIGLNLTINLLYSPHPRIPRDVLQEYNYIKGILDQPDTKKKTTTDGISDFVHSEWPVMTLSLASYGMRNLAMADPSLKEEVSHYLKKAIHRAMKPEYYHFIVSHYGNPFEKEEVWDNTFYLGHFTAMLGFYREVSGKDDFDELFHKFTKSFYDNFTKSPTLCLTSYPGMTWTSEQVVPFRALKVHDEAFGTNYSEVIIRWAKLMEQDFFDPKSQLMVTDIDNQSGMIYSGPRTIAITWTILFLHDIVPEFSRNLYFNLKKHLMVKRLGFPMFKEYLYGNQRATGDTGPIIWGVSPVSTSFSLGCAALMGDDAVYRPTKYLTDPFALSVTYFNKRKYLLGGQVGTAAMFWIKSMEVLHPPQKKVLPLGNLAFIYGFILFMVGYEARLLSKLISAWKILIKG